MTKMYLRIGPVGGGGETISFAYKVLDVSPSGSVNTWGGTRKGLFAHVMGDTASITGSDVTIEELHSYTVAFEGGGALEGESSTHTGKWYWIVPSGPSPSITVAGSYAYGVEYFFGSDLALIASDFNEVAYSLPLNSSDSPANVICTLAIAPDDGEVAVALAGFDPSEASAVLSYEPGSTRPNDSGYSAFGGSSFNGESYLIGPDVTNADWDYTLTTSSSISFDSSFIFGGALVGPV